ncbi:hypothetical protein [uncultured Imperialibacter sp.]|uniref:hypothetical protein n=1 Tax=uncultured Imperialibacter sp. TaxID=1672639 RepID=UPI0030DC5711
MPLQTPSIDAVNFFPSDQQTILFGDAVIDISMTHDGEAYGYQLLLNNDTVFSGRNEPRMAYFDTREFEDGNYLLELKVFFKTNTNSIADQLGTEVVIYSVSKSVKIDNTSGISKPKLKAFSVSDGELYLEVEPFSDNFGFESWVLLDGNQNPISTFVVESATKMLVPGYFGQPIDLYVRLNAKQRTEVSDLIHYKWNYDIEMTKSDGNIKIEWNEPPFNNYEIMEVYNWSGTPSSMQRFTGRSNANVAAGTQFYHRYFITLTAKSRSSQQSLVGRVWARSNAVAIPTNQEQIQRYTFRNDSVLSVFRFLVDGNRFDYGDYSATNYLIRSNSFAENDSLIELVSQNQIAFSYNFNKVAQIGSGSFSFLDTMTLQPVSTYHYADLISPSDVSQLYLSNDNTVGFLHNQNTTISLYDLSTGSVVDSYDYDCSQIFTYGQSYDINQAGLIFTKAYNGLSSKLGVVDGRIGCPGNTPKTMWFDKGYVVNLDGGGFPYNNYNEIAIEDLNGTKLTSKSIENAYHYPGIYQNLYFLVHVNGYVKGYDLSNNIEEVFSFYSPNLPSIGYVQPQLKAGRFSILTSENQLFFKDFD